MRCKNCGVSVACSVFDGEVELVDLKTGRAHHCRTASGYAALVDAARDLLEYVEADLRRDREERRVPRPGLGVLADDLRAALGALR